MFVKKNKSLAPPNKRIKSYTSVTHLQLYICYIRHFCFNNKHLDFVNLCGNINMNNPQESEMAEFKVALKAIIQKDGKILVLKRSCEEDVFAELWDIPGGKIEYGEKIIDGIKREVFEETGLDVEIEFRPWSLWSFMTPAKERQTVGITLLAKYLGGEVKLSNEHTDYKWIYPSEFADMSADPSLKNEIAKYAEQK